MNGRKTEMTADKQGKAKAGGKSQGRASCHAVAVWKRLIQTLCLVLLFCFGTSACLPQSMAGNEAFAETVSAGKTSAFDLSTVPAYQSAPYVSINNGVPFFTDAELTTDAFERYSELDAKGRCGVAYANVCREIMPTEKRGAIGSVKPSGWQTAKYDFVDGKYLYNRCHLIGYQLSAENANEKNLITGTRYMNVDGMLPFENMVADYVKETDNHVLYRVTPIFEGDNLLASGVLMEAKSVEDAGKGILFCVYVYNVQPGVSINYATGDSTVAAQTGDTAAAAGTAQAGSAADAGAIAQAAGAGSAADTAVQAATGAEQQQPTEAQVTATEYVLNTNSHKFHRSNCASVERMSEKNKRVVKETREQILEEGYEPCKNCNP